MPSLSRIQFEELPPALSEELRPRVERLGYFGEFFQCAAHQPEALRAFMAFTEAGKKGLSDRLVEVVALTAASWMGSDYERNQHERLSVRLGFGRDWVQAVNALRPESEPGLSEEERQVQRLVLVMLETRGKGAGEQFERCADALGSGAAVAVLMVVGRYVVHGLIVNTLGLNPPVPSIFEDGFGE
jgi:alkylhydroperoxidase family enzyme